ncbi:glycosyltransferase family 2 protein [Roseovarius sp. LXJ103]|uniref:glycosyltransferase family 2 protein n=1 Tax=Roseovarius carneus TaxID=2853164 RepID=UPI000D616044|nr:glycosyltransferase family 2 protein [Roseovarius carneus]MBZ8119621.1 glycosyltransferase family 2 protein [Roseovarius carneus]PWE34763.1 glycosyltransferase family 2 protein [Pelagicola sp. LXJ1103]
MTLPKWGLVSTIKAPCRDILNFAAHHLDLGAHRLHIYLDVDAPEARAALEAHPRCHVTLCDDAYWAQRRKRPEKHQGRQSLNATRAYRRRPGVDWLGHIDVDEFLIPTRTLAEALADVPGGNLTARVRPVEALAPDPNDPGGPLYFKSCHIRPKLRGPETEVIYPTFGAHLSGGFLSHVSGKIFVRTGAEDLKLRIHNAFVNNVQIENSHTLPQTLLAHMHAPSWERWLEAYRYRLAQGSYRAELKGAAAAGTPMNTLFSMIEAEGGETALHAFYDEVCTATPALRERLAAHGHLHQIDLDLDAKRSTHFPDHA